MEHAGIGTGQIGINHRDHESIEQKADDVECRLCPIRIEPGDLQFLILDLIGDILDAFDYIFDAVPDHQNNKQVRYIFHNRLQHHFDRFYDVKEDFQSQFFRLRENSEQYRYTEHQLYQQHDVPQEVTEKNQYPSLAVRVQKFIITDDDRFQSLLFETYDLPA